MSFLILCVLCVIQGLTEFLPVSSSGHLLLFEQIFRVEGNTLFFNLFLHLATLLAVVIVYRKSILKIIKKPFQPLTYKLILSTVITCIFAALYEIINIERAIKTFYFIFFFVTSILLFSTYKFQKNANIIKVGEMSYKKAAIVGLVQGFAVFPGLSRSGSTISAMILSGQNESDSAEYSFLLSVPIIIGGFVFEIIKNRNFAENFIFSDIKYYIFAFFLTFFVSIISLKITIKMLKNKKFNIFAIYTFVVGLITLMLNIFVF